MPRQHERIWTSSQCERSPEPASVPTPLMPKASMLALALLIVGSLSACVDEDPIGPEGLCNNTGAVGSIELATQARTIYFRTPIRTSDTLRIVPVVLTEAGQINENAPLRFSSSDTTVVVVDSTGLIRPRAEGQARIRIESCYEDVEIEVDSRPLIASVALVPEIDSMVEGDTITLTARALSQFGAHVRDVTTTWSIVEGTATLAPTSDSTVLLRATGPVERLLVRARVEGAVGDDDLAILANVISTLGVGRDVSCALYSLGRLHCWGRGDVGQLGVSRADSVCFDDVDPIGPFRCSLIPVRSTGAPRFATVAVGGQHACALSVDGEAWCWGANETGQVGDGSVTPRTTATQATAPVSFSAISLGGYHSCALTALGAAWCWGQDSLGQLGWDKRVHSTTPVPVSGGISFVALAAGDQHTCGVDTGGAAWCWGLNTTAQVGISGGGFLMAPRQVSTTERFVSITAGRSHSCGLTSAGVVLCWGANTAGQLGVAAPSSSFTPLAVSGFTFTAVAAGGDHTCGLIAGGTALCWGANEYGQLGIGTASGSVFSPQMVATDVRFTELEIGRRHSCGRTPDGEAYCWGSDVLGALGDELQAIYSTFPLPVARPR